MSEPFIPHSRPALGEAEAKAVAEVVRGGWIAEGRQVAAFERAVAKVTGQAQGVAVSSGTAALYLALMSLGIGSDDEVVIPSYVCTALWHAVRLTGAKPVLVDIEPTTYQPSPQAVARALTRHTKAVIVPHMFGLPADIGTLKSHGIPVIEDCAQTMGVPVRGTPVGGSGEMAICSFYATKLLTAGEGGMVLGREESLVSRVRTLRQYDQQDALDPAFNYKMTDMQAALGLCQVARLEGFLTRRRAIAARYHEAVRQAGLTPPVVPAGLEHGYFRYVVRLSNPVDSALDLARTLGIGCRRPVYRPIHRYMDLSSFPETDAAWERALSIPLYPALTDHEVDRVVSALQAILAG
ncbi:MAG: DegT/DnrJ/EryC1/StrS aminotransferase family protein [Nitrospirae bacterium]|nr:MAG: DegT/DnrJ/EryC1/StrS aminotransferase family protein [Nitrospirota bacterium]